jgi:hypothetical protein
MSIAKCVVRLKDSHDTVHEAVVHAESLYEAVLRGLNRLVDVGWESDTGETIRHLVKFRGQRRSRTGRNRKSGE